MYFSFTVMANLQDFWDKVNSLMSFGLPLPTVLAFPSIPFALFDQTLYKKTQFWRQIYFPITFNFKMVWIKADGIYIIQQQKFFSVINVFHSWCKIQRLQLFSPAWSLEMLCRAHKSINRVASFLGLDIIVIVRMMQLSFHFTKQLSI